MAAPRESPELAKTLTVIVIYQSRPDWSQQAEAELGSGGQGDPLGQVVPGGVAQDGVVRMSKTCHLDSRSANLDPAIAVDEVAKALRGVELLEAAQPAREHRVEGMAIIVRAHSVHR